jgi:hypothetical protein
MKRARQWLLNSLTILSLVVFAATVAMWARSTRRYDDIDHVSATQSANQFNAWRFRFTSFHGAIFRSGFEIYFLHYSVNGSGFLYDMMHTLGRGNPNGFSNWPTTSEEMNRLINQLNGTIWETRTALGWDASPMGYRYRPMYYQNTSAWDGWFDIPYWLPATLFLFVPGFRLIIYIRTRRQIPPGFCKNCGYDLRATPNQCPECGMLVPPATA